MDKETVDQLKKLCANKSLRELILDPSKTSELSVEDIAAGQKFLLGLDESKDQKPHIDICS